MRYDENDNLLYFSTEESTSFEEKRLIIDHMARVSMDLLGSAFKEGGVFRGGAAGEDRPKSSGNPMAAVGAIVIFLGVIGGIMVRSFVAAAVAAGIGLLLLSIACFTGNNISSENKYSQLNDGKLLNGKASGVGLLAFALACLIPAGLYVAMDMEPTPAMVLGIGCFLVAAVVMNIAGIISGNNKAKNVYTGTVNARCIGYLKKTRTSSNNSRHGYHRNRIYIVGTPVFEYEYSMNTHKAFLNEYSQGRLKPSYSEQVELNINPEDPDDILYLPFLKKRNTTLIVTGIILFICAVICFVALTII